MHIRRHNHAIPRAGSNVDMWVHAPLADQPQLIQPIQQRSQDFGAFAYQHQRFGIAKPRGQHIHVLNMIVPDLDLVALQLFETRQRT